MTVSSTSSRVVYNGDGSTTSWPFAFKITDSSAIVVVYTDGNGTSTTLNYGSQYTATGFGLDAGGSVTYPLSGSPIATGTTLTIYRNVSPTQPTSISNQGAMWPSVIEAAFDRLTYIAQGFVDGVNRGLKIAVTDGSSLNPLPTAGVRAGKFLCFDQNGQPVAVSAAGTWRSTWVTATTYNVGDLVQDGPAGANTSNVYYCKSGHTSGTWSTDLGNGLWLLAVNVATFTSAAAASATSAAASAASASTNAASAATNASSAATNAASATTSAASASSAASAAAASASSAGNSATTAQTYAAALSGTSTTSMTIGTGSISFSAQAGKQFSAGMWIEIVDQASTVNYMIGQCTAYNSSTGAMAVNVTATGGSGTKTAWNIYLSGVPGAAAVGGVLAANNLSDLANFATSRNNLGAIGKINVQKFSSSGTYIPSPNLLFATVECVGGGGGGGGTNGAGGNRSTGAGGGGAGSRSIKIATAAQIGSSQTIAIGSKGNGASAGANSGLPGGDTSFGSLCVGKGGGGGQGCAAAGNGGQGGQGGGSGTGDLTPPGYNGDDGGGTKDGSYNVNSIGGNGASGPYGQGGLGVAVQSGHSNGNAGSGFGSGGSGGSSSYDGTSTAGGDGTAGYVVIWEYLSS